MFAQLRILLHISHSHGIIRRYFVVNGFDGALTMLGLCMGFYFNGQADVGVVFHACLGAAIALGVSGASSAYISESAEKRKELTELEQATISSLEETHFGKAARLVPIVIAVVNGAAPLLISLIIIAPLFLENWQSGLVEDPLIVSIGSSFVLIFLLGVFLGRISGLFWLWSGLRAVLTAVVTAALVFFMSPT
jgi:predicted membrane protein (TIGR00267 family)